MGHIERRQKEKEEMRQRILETARKIGARDGWQALTIRKIADEIEYTPPIVYEHFASKEELIKEIIYSGFSTLSEEFVIAREAEPDPKNFIKRLSMIHWDFAFSNVELYQLMFSLDRPMHNEEMSLNIKMIENAFLNICNNNVEILHELMFNWMCLMQGAISIVMKITNLPHQEGKNPRDVYSRIIDRFVDSIDN
ncbi:MAG: TetR/AcrR family transcriptional regulator [Ignavibacteriales bacterium]|nr:MAG: TetR/AcrR family transcriptional regulator [Ignavibacteriales bacterium]